MAVAFGPLARRAFPFAGSWRSMLAAALVPTAVLVSLMLLLQPMGLAGYDGGLREIKVVGFGLTVLVPALAWYPVERAVFRRQGGHWTLALELVSLGVLITAGLVGAHVYNELTLNRWPEPDLSLAALARFSASVGLPYATFIAPAWLGGRWWFGARPGPGTAEAGLRIRGDNAGEVLSIRPAQFRYAVAEGNYVELFYERAGGLASYLLRASLKRVARQIPHARPVHRSYLVAPQLIERLEGNARSARVWLRDVDRPVPVSPRHYSGLKRELARS